MQKVTTIKLLQEIVKQWRRDGQSIAFVPTMGNLHAGHVKLASEAKKKADRTIVSIFVNPTQFGPGEDFETYPRTEHEDTEKLKSAGVDLLFLPDVEQIYQQKINTVISVKGLSTRICGASRVGHFDGVATVVAKLFNIVQADMAFFGEKDFQQLAIIKMMVIDLNIPIEIFGVATERESDGLAMSSRNSYLTEQQRLLAPEIYRSLCKAKENILIGKLNLRDIEKEGLSFLEMIGFSVEYFLICSVKNLQLANENESELLILVAAKLGKPRLIDNLLCYR